MAKLRVTLVKSGIGYAEDQKRTLKALGLRRMNQSVVHEDSPSLRGMRSNTTAWNVSPSSISTCITATAPKTSFATIRAC